MKQYQYQVLRYKHDIVTGEFVNVGIVVYQPKTNFFKAEMLNKYARISRFFKDVNGTHILQMLKAISSHIIRVNKELSELFANDHKQESLEEITNKILPRDDGSLYFSEVKFGMDISAELALQDLFERLVTKYQEDENASKTDEDVWKELYKKYFDEYKIIDKLSRHTIQTDTDEFKFDKAWKNGSWHVYEALSFDLKEDNNIKDKVYKWNGRIQELDSSNENLDIYFLTSMPKKAEVKKFIEKKMLEQKLEHIKIHLVKEEEARQFANKVKTEMDEHSQQLHIK